MKLLFILLIAGTVMASSVKERNHFISTENEERSDPYPLIEEAEQLLQEGDLVLRLNHDPMSRFIKDFNHRDKKYSHAGIVLYDNGYPFIYHIVNGEENPGEKLRKDSLSRFADPRKNYAFGIFRYTLSTGEVKKVKDQLRTWCQQGIQFDPLFDFADDQKMYCSELIGKLMAKATSSRISMNPVQLNATEAAAIALYTRAPLEKVKGKSVLPIDELYNPSFCTMVKEYSYQ